MITNRLDVPLYDNGQSIKDCKKQTPDYAPPNPKKSVEQVGFRTKDIVWAHGTCLVNKTDVWGVFRFDSYDKYDNTCYVVKGTMTYNVTLDKIRLANNAEKMLV